MSKLRVYEIARELKIETKDMVAKCKAAGIQVASHQSTLTNEQIEKLRSVYGQSGDKKDVAKAAMPKVIRRRRVAEEEVAPADSVAAPAVPDAAAEPAASSPVESQLAAELEPPRVEERSAAPAAAAAAPPAEPQPAAKVEQPVLRPRTQRMSSAATIVRKVTPEELAKQQREREESRQRGEMRARPGDFRRDEVGRTDFRSRDGRGTIRREDSRGMRVTGLGLHSDKPAGFGRPAEEPALPVDALERDRRRRLEEKPRSTTKAEEEEQARQAKIQKQKRAQLNLRSLLSQAEDGEDEVLEAEEAPVEEGTEGAADDRQAKRTVYMPTAQQRKRDLKRRKDLKKTQITTPRAEKRVVRMGNVITVGELAKQLSVKSSDVIKKLMSQGVMASVNENIDQDTATLIAAEYGYEVKSDVRTIEDILMVTEAEMEAAVKAPRAPIVTVMGHVDHGKTSILDAIRQSDVAAGEAGGITQHIGAYAVTHNGKSITFIDTPGHEAFSAMRARGAALTDIVILVVAADDGVMPQTVEAISHARDADVPVIVAINKIDKHNINLDRIFTGLAEHGIQSEEWGGENIFVKCSALKKLGIDEILDAVLLQAEVLELQAAMTARADGVVIEAHLDSSRGPVATVIVRNGVLTLGDLVVAGTETGRVRAMEDHRGMRVESAGPSMPVTILGLSGVPLAGDVANVVENEQIAREAVLFRQEQKRSAGGKKSSAQTLDDLLGKVKQVSIPEVSLIIKADTQGSVEALSDALTKLSTEKVRARIVHKAVGGVTESDIALAAAGGAVIVAFNVRGGRGLDEVAEREGVVIRYFSIIYEAVDAVKAIMAGKLPPVIKEVVVGHAEVRQPISVPKVGTIAGSAVIDGKIVRNAHLRLIRDEIVIYSGKLGSLRRFKDDVKEVQHGYECGIGIEGYNDIKVGDVIEAFILEEEAATL